jgi:signal transduction histidine kinase
MIQPRIVVASLAVALGLVLRYVLDLPIDFTFFWFVLAWFLASLLFFGRLIPPQDSPDYRKVGVVFFVFEVAVAALAAGALGFGGWLAVPLVLFPTLEWTGTSRGRWDLVGAAVAGLAAGGVVAMETLAAGVGTEVQAAGIAEGLVAQAGAFGGLAAALVIGLSAGVGRLVAADQRDKERLQDIARDLIIDTEDLRDTNEEIERAYAELKEAQAELVNSARLTTLGTLVAGVAHELNTPLGAINSNHDVIERALNGLQDILEDEVVTPDELEQVRRIVRAMDGVLKTNGLAVERMVGLVGNLRTFGRPDRAEVDRVDLHEGLDGTLAILAHQLRGIEIIKDYGEIPLVECYPNKLNQVFMNLLINGRQAIKDEGSLTIETRAHGDAVSVQIADTGSGIEPEILDKIFEPGFTTKGARMGMGLGLLITKQIIDQHQGTIEVDSVVGEGTTFTVRIPVRLAHQEPLELPGMSEESLQGGTP